MARTKNRMRRLRFDHEGLTQEELADRVNCTQKTTIALEQDKYVPSLERGFRVANAIGVPLGGVFQYEDSWRG